MSEDPGIGISRLDQESSGTHGWQVRIQRRGVRHGRFFSDAAWGGRSSALETAQRYRDRLIGRAERSGGPETISSRSRVLPDSRNQSGVVGVARIVQRGPDGTEYLFWQANWTTEDGIRRSVRFSILKHGEDTAFELACRARRNARG